MAIQNHNTITAEITAIEARNVERHAPLPGLQAAFDKERAAWITTKHDCESRLKEAEARLNAARKAVEQVERLRLESTEPAGLKLLRLKERNRHLFGNVEPEQLRQIVRPEHRSVFS